MQIIGTPLLHDPSQKVTVGCPPGFCWSRTDPLLQQPFATPGLNSRIRSLALLPFCFIFSLSVNLPLGCLIPDSLLCGRLSQEAVVYSWTVPCSTDLNPTMDLCSEQPLPSVTKKRFSFFFPPPPCYFPPLLKVTDKWDVCAGPLSRLLAVVFCSRTQRLLIICPQHKHSDALVSQNAVGKESASFCPWRVVDNDKLVPEVLSTVHHKLYHYKESVDLFGWGGSRIYMQ